MGNAQGQCTGMRFEGCQTGPCGGRSEPDAPEIYLTEMLKRLPHNATPAQAAELTPARFAAAFRVKAQEVA